MNRMLKRVTLVLTILCIGGAFGLGWWPEHERRIALEQELSQVRAGVAASEASVRLCQLRNQLQSLIDFVDAKNFGAAQTASSAYFDGIRAETIGAADRPEFDKILAQRDDVTAALARSDPGVAATLRAMRAPLTKLQAQIPGGSTESRQ
jgi:hypothetical protein